MLLLSMKQEMKVVHKLDQMEKSLSTLQQDVHEIKTAFAYAQLTEEEKRFVAATLKKLKKGDRQDFVSWETASCC